MKFEPPARGSQIVTVWGGCVVRSIVVHATKSVVLVRTGATSSCDEVLPDQEGQTWVRGWEGPQVEALKTVLALSSERRIQNTVTGRWSNTNEMSKRYGVK